MSNAKNNGAPIGRTKEEIETAKEKPPGTKVNAAAIPPILRELVRWVLWCWQKSKKGRWTKVPYDPHQRRTKAKPNDPATWGTLDQARATWQADPDFYDGVGFMFAEGDGLTGIDLDKSIDLDTGTLKPWAQSIVNDLATYTERSPTKTGLKLWAKADKPGADWCKEPFADGEIEMYDRDRFFTFTGDCWPDTPATIEERQEQVGTLYHHVLDAKTAREAAKKARKKTAAPSTAPPSVLADDELIARAERAKNGARFRALMAGDTSSYDGDASRADLALCCLVAFYTKDPSQIDRVFRRSKLLRDKWDERRKDSTYGADTIARALDLVTEQWTPRRPRPSLNGDGTPHESNGQPAAPARPVVVISTREHDVNDSVIATLPSAPDLFQRGNRLATVLRDTAVTSLRAVTRPAGTPRIALVPAPRLREILTRQVDFVKVVATKDGEELVAAHPPAWCVGAVESRGDWPGVRHLEAVIETPTLRPDGTIISTPGWDEQTGLLYDPNTVYPPIPQMPSRADAVRAAEAILDLVAEFPFVRIRDEDTDEDDEGMAHRAAWLAACLTPLARFAVRGPCPLFLFDANCPGTGKSKLADVIALIATGRDMSRTSLPDNDEEMRKRVTSIALAGDLLMLVDNIDRPLGGASLDAILTATTWRDRILGKSEMTAELPLHTVWFGTGNNVSLKGDSGRRILPSRLDSSEEHPEERSGFKYPRLLEHIDSERPSLVCAGLTILRAYFAAGCPTQDLAPFGSYESWSDVVRAPVRWVLGVDPCATRRGMRAADPKVAALAALLTGWAELPSGKTGLTVAEAVRILENPDSADQFDTLRDVLLEESRNGKLSPAAIGCRLRSARGRVVNGLRMETASTEGHGGGTRWKVMEAATEGVPF